MLSIFTNLHGSQTARGTGGRLLGFRDLQTYMVLKLANDVLVVKEVLDPYKLTWFSNLSNLILNRPCFRSLQTYMVLKL